MKLVRVTKLLIASWLILSCFITPMSVLAEGEITDATVQPITGTISPPTTEQTTSVNNDLSLNTTSGDSTAADNTEIGSLSTGDSSSTTTVVITDSATSVPQTESFNLSPTPNTTGDVTITLPAQLSPEVLTTIIPLTTDTVTATNTITISSLSGSANADSNTLVSQINTGDAYSNANLINILGSTVSAPEIFLGYITVNGNLTGDLLLPADILQSINTPAIANFPQESYGTETSKTYSVNNSTDATATSGSLLASSNSEIESAQSGNAVNMLNSIDLIGANIYGQTGLLVFINVSGTWDGSILGQDPGIKAALIGSSGANSSPFLIPLDTTTAITLANKINISAISGNITANKNTSVGDMATGNATTVVNIANILGSNLIFTKQFGILFVTILGNWYGSFGFDTPYGNPPKTPESSTSPASSNQNNISVNSTFISIRNIDTSTTDDNEGADVELSSFSYSSPENKMSKIVNKNKSLADYMFWGIPLIGGSIALGLFNTDKKLSKSTKK